MAATTAPSRAGTVRGLARSLREPWSDRRTETVLAAVSCLVLALIAGMIIFVFAKAWPSFSANGLIGWFGAGRSVDEDLGRMVQAAGGGPTVLQFRAWPLIWATLLTSGGAILVGLPFALLSAVFMVEFAPPRLQAILTPVVSLLAAVPSVVYGLIGILVLAPFIGGLISTERKESVAGIIQLSGEGLITSVIILAIMIVPIMIAIIAQALRQVPRGWTEGAAALGVNRWRVMWTISVRTARPAIIAASILAVGRAIGEAIMLAMVSGGTAFAPNPIDGITFFFEPLLPLAATIVFWREGLASPPLAQTLYAIAAILLVSSMFLSLGGYLAKQPMKKYGIRP